MIIEKKADNLYKKGFLTNDTVDVYKELENLDELIINYKSDLINKKTKDMLFNDYFKKIEKQLEKIKICEDVFLNKCA